METNALVMLPAMHYWHFQVPTGCRNRYEKIYYILFHKHLKNEIRLCYTQLLPRNKHTPSRL